MHGSTGRGCCYSAGRRSPSVLTEDSGTARCADVPSATPVAAGQADRSIDGPLVNSPDLDVDSGFGPAGAAAVRLIVVTLSMLVGWALWLLLSVGATMALAPVFTDDAGWIPFLVAIFGTPLGVGAGASAATWFILRRAPRKTRARAAAVPFGVTLAGFGLALAASGLADAANWTFFAAASMAAITAVWVSSPRRRGTE